MTFTETTTQEFLGKNEDLGIQEIIASSQKLLNQASNSNNSNSSSNNNNINSGSGSGSNNITNIGTTTDIPATSAFSLHPGIISQDKNRLRPRKNSKNKHTIDNYFGDASDCSLPASNNGSTPSLLSMTGTGIPSPPIMSTTNLNDNNTNDNNNNNNNISSSTTNHLHHNHNQNIPHNMNSSNFRNIRVKSSSHREKVDSDNANKDIPISPPELIKDPTTETFSTHAYSWPILFAVIPPMGALIFGKSDVWSDFLLLLLIAFYLYNIIKVPWELYYAARTRRVRKENSPQNKTPPNPEEEASKKQAAKELQRQELYALVLVIASPIIGGYALHGAKMYLTDYDKYISHFNIVLFVFAAGIRPLMHIANLAKNRTLHLQEEVHYPSAEVEMLKKRLQTVESQLAQINRSLATKRDILNVKDGFEPTIVQLNKAVRRYEKKEQYLRNYSEERFAYLEAKLHEYDTFIAYKLQEDQSMILPRSMMQIMFMPLNITLTVFGYAKYFLPRFLRGSRQKPMLQPAVTSDNDVDIGIGFNNNNNNNNNIISNNNKLVGENIQQQDGSLISGSLQKY